MSNQPDAIHQAHHHDNCHAPSDLRVYFNSEPPSLSNQPNAKVPTKKVRTWMLILLAFGVCFFLAGVSLMTRSTKRSEYNKPEFVAGSVLLALALASFLAVAVLCFYHRKKLCDDNIFGSGRETSGCGIENPGFYLPTPTHRIKTRFEMVKTNKDNIPTTSGVSRLDANNDQTSTPKRRNTFPI